MKEATELFSYAEGTSWAKMLGNNIYQAAVYHVSISLSLEDILIQLRSLQKLREMRRRTLSEPKRMLWFLPVMYVFLSVITVRYLGITWSHYLENQFRTEQGLLLISFGLMGTLISSIYLSFLSSKRFDY